MLKSKHQILTCRFCNAELTVPLTAITTVDEMKQKCRFEEEFPICPPQHFLVLKGDILRDPMRFSNGWIPKTDAWINLEDLTSSVRLTTDKSRLNGCCGLDGCDGANRTCACGQYVGTEQSDCWTYRVFERLPDTTLWKNTI